MTGISRTSLLRRGVAGATTAAAALALTLSFAPAQASPEAPTPPGVAQSTTKQRPVDVMSRNLYLGADLMPIIGALMTPPDPNDPLKVPNAAAATWGKVQATKPAERMAAIAKEIAAEKPAVVGLQEVTTWTSYAFNPGTATFSDPTVEFDFLELLLDALEAEGMSYAEVEGATSANFVSPPIPYTNLQSPPDVTRAIQLADRDVIIARSDVAVSNPHNDNFVEMVKFTLPGQPALEVLRGWGSVDVTAQRAQFRFVNAHLEAFAVPGENAEAYRVAQVAELLAAQAALAATKPMPIVYAGDYNSEAPDALAYTALVEGVGYDAWTLTSDQLGYTCCFDSDVTNESEPLDQRIDLVLVGDGIKAVDTEIVGEEPADMTPSGLWPSDHAGLVATLLIGQNRGWARGR